MTNRQSWALFCATGLDCRGLPLSVGDASHLLMRFDNGDKTAVIEELRKMGAKGKGKNTTDYALVHDEAHRAGMEAAESHTPTPMVVEQHATPLDDNSPVTQRWVVNGGVCGFAWVKFAGNTAWAKWAKKNAGASKCYPSGVSIWVSNFGQSMELKEQYARAYAKKLNEHGIKAYACSRMD
jgi:hypothetical protein